MINDINALYNNMYILVQIMTIYVNRYLMVIWFCQWTAVITDYTKQFQISIDPSGVVVYGQGPGICKILQNEYCNTWYNDNNNGHRGIEILDNQY